MKGHIGYSILEINVLRITPMGMIFTDLCTRSEFSFQFIKWNTFEKSKLKCLKFNKFQDVGGSVWANQMLVGTEAV